MFAATVTAVRILGKAAIVQLTPYDLATIVLISTVLAEPLVSEQSSRALLGAGAIVALHGMVARLTLTRAGRRWFLGEPTILVKHGKLVEPALRSTRTSVEQVLAFLRASGQPRLEDVEYAILEPIGQITVIPRQSAAPITPGDLGLPQPYAGLPLPLVIDGSVYDPNLALIGRDRAWLRQRLAAEGVAIQRVLYAAASEDGTLYVNLRGGRALKIPFASEPEAPPPRAEHGPRDAPEPGTAPARSQEATAGPDGTQPPEVTDAQPPGAGPIRPRPLRARPLRARPLAVRRPR